MLLHFASLVAPVGVRMRSSSTSAQLLRRLSQLRLSQLRLTQLRLTQLRLNRMSFWDFAIPKKKPTIAVHGLFYVFQLALW